MPSDLFIFFQNVNTSLLQVAMLGKNLSHLTSGGGEDGESGCFSTFSLLLSQSQTFFFSHNPWHFLFLSCSVRFVSRRGPLCLWQHREEAACRGGGQAGELRLEFVVDLYQVARCGVWNPRICLKRDKHRPSPFVHKWTKFPATELTFTWLRPLPLLLSLSVANLNKVLLQLRPTTGRVPIPPECADGTIAVCVTGWVSKKRK